MKTILMVLAVCLFLFLVGNNAFFYGENVKLEAELKRVQQDFTDFLAYTDLFTENKAEIDISKQLTEIKKEIGLLRLGINSMTKSYADTICPNR